MEWIAGIGGTTKVSLYYSSHRVSMISGIDAIRRCGWKIGCTVILALCISGSKGASLSNLFALTFFVKRIAASRRVTDYGL